jgi:hypothetical protein
VRPRRSTLRGDGDEVSVTMTEPVVVHHGRQDDGPRHDDVRPTVATAC